MSSPYPRRPAMLSKADTDVIAEIITRYYQMTTAQDLPPLIETANKFRRELVDAVLAGFNNNRNMAARYLQVNRTTLLSILQRTKAKQRKLAESAATKPVYDTTLEQIRCLVMESYENIEDSGTLAKHLEVLGKKLLASRLPDLQKLGRQAISIARQQQKLTALLSVLGQELPS